MSITLEQAEYAVNGAIAKAEELGITQNIAVVDAGGRLVAFKRMDGAMWAGMYGCQGKAIAAAAFRYESGLAAEQYGHLPIFEGVRWAEGKHMIASQGAVPIFLNGDLIGAIGCGGTTGQEDEDCARAGAEAVQAFSRA